ncbi:hypothetical protein HID58_086320 [Brassica napus]|uniref:Uncharacterized protein n=1 Tax=Brassica napus TaxID=3708 RepID=A0ABQ7XRG4_BRANA|nr:hypothetical protein HID58_086320 [Brassica napus]
MRLSLTHGRKELSYDSNNSCSTRFSYSATSISDYTSTSSYTNRLTTTAPKVAPVISPAASLHNHHKARLCQLQPSTTSTSSSQAQEKAQTQETLPCPTSSTNSSKPSISSSSNRFPGHVSSTITISECERRKCLELARRKSSNVAQHCTGNSPPAGYHSLKSLAFFSLYHLCIKSKSYIFPHCIPNTFD